ncbi:MAG: hypothetical protein DI561_08535 [Thauera sp.]|nr:MAG: hypothetical protein DI561_08535 [Thauera sp.]
MGASLNEGGIVARQQGAGEELSPARTRASWPRFSANAAHHDSTSAHDAAPAAPGLRNWTAGELAALLCEFLKREHAALAACHGQQVESDWIPLARALTIRLSEAPGMSLATSPLKTRFLLREQIGAWLVHTALDASAAHTVRIALPDTWSNGKVLAYLFRHEIAPMHHVTAALRSLSVPLALSEDVAGDSLQVNG